MPVSAGGLADRLAAALDGADGREEALAAVRAVVEEVVADEVGAARREAEEAGKLAVLKQLAELGDLVDSLHARLDGQDATGAKALDRRLDRILGAHGFERTPTVGSSFDPRWHEIAGVEVDHDEPAGAVVREVGRGYRRDGFALCPARVVVAD